MMIDPNMMKRVMKQLNMKDIPATEVIIKTPDKNIIIKNPTVQQMKIGGQDAFQVSGEITEEGGGDDTIEVTEDDIKLIMEKTGKTRQEVLDALAETNGDIAEAILKLT